jgi:hypothetical protein
LLDGTPITREIPDVPALDSSRSPLARGGNTLVLRPALLARLPNLAPCIGGRVSRRSDMIWARLAVALEGARFARAPITAFQDRSGPGRSSFDVEKLLDDVRGSALVAALDALVEEGHLARRSLDRPAVEYAVEIYVSRARERLDTIALSEDRVRRLLDEIVSIAQPPRSRVGLLHHTAHAEALAQLRAHTSRLQTAYEANLLRHDPTAEQAEIAQFFLDLLNDVDAYRGALAPRRERVAARAMLSSYVCGAIEPTTVE